MNRSDGVAPETTDGLDELLPMGRVPVGLRFGQHLRLGFRPQKLNDRVDLRRIALVKINAIDRSAIVAVVPEPRHAGLGLEVLGVGEPLAHPLFGEFTGHRRQIRTDLPDVFVTGNLVTSEASVNPNQVSAIAERGRAWNFIARVMAFETSCLDVVHRKHRRFQEVLNFPAVFLFPILLLLFVARSMAGRLKVHGPVQSAMAGGAAELLHRVRGIRG